jgi:nucleoside-diphosphate-sugar epimerase
VSSGREALVTGACGFIGRHLVRRLDDDGWRVTAVDLQARADDLQSENVSYRSCDIRDTATLESLLPRGGTVFHLASVHLDVGVDEAIFEAVNVRAASDLVDACQRAGVARLVHTSSVGIYGDVERVPATEASPKQPQTPYERTKLAGERAVLARASELGVDVVAVRPAWVYGPGCPRTTKLIDALRRGRFFYVGNGKNLRHPLYIDEMVDAFLLAERAPSNVAGNAYLIAGPRYMTLREMVDTFARALGLRSPRLRIPRPVGWCLGLTAETVFRTVGKEPPFSRRSLAFFENDNGFDIHAAREDLGFDPRVDLEEGLRLTLEATGQAAVA